MNDMNKENIRTDRSFPIAGNPEKSADLSPPIFITLSQPKVGHLCKNFDVAVSVAVSHATTRQRGSKRWTLWAFWFDRSWGESLRVGTITDWQSHKAPLKAAGARDSDLRFGHLVERLGRQLLQSLLRVRVMLWRGLAEIMMCYLRRRPTTTTKIYKTTSVRPSASL